MKKTWIIVLLAMLALSMQAVPTTPPPTKDTTSCEWQRWYYEAPEFFCECTYNSHTFVFPMDTVLSGSTWFTATVNDLKQGLAAYWFSSDPVTMEVYPLCVSQTPVITVTIGGNRMYEMDMTEINQKLDEMANMSYLQALTPHIHVYTAGTGRVFCYPYDQGPHSTCQDALEMRPGMTFVCNHEENVYRLDWRQIPTRGRAILRWLHRPKGSKQTCQPAEVWITRDSCNGEEVARATLIDSLHVYQLDSAMLVDTRTAKRNLWVHVQHAAGFTGRLTYYNNPLVLDSLEAINQSICQGMMLTVNMRDYKADTTFVDTVWIGRDTLSTQAVTLRFTQPSEIKDTVYATSRQLSSGYLHTPTGYVLYEYGDTIIDIVKEKTCTKRYHVWVMQPTANEQIEDGAAARKQLLNGQLLIIVDDKRYNLLGQQVKH